MKEHDDYTQTESGEDTIYVYKEDEESPSEDCLDTSGPNFSQAEYEEAPENGSPTSGQDAGHPAKQPSPFVILLNILINPVEGWKMMRRAKHSPEKVMGECFAPLLSLLFISRFSDILYSTGKSAYDMITGGIASTVAMFFSYFCIVIFARMLAPKYFGSPLTSSFGKSFILYSLSSLCIFFALPEIFPMLWAVLIFLPLWTAYTIFKGARFFRFPAKKESTCTLVLTVAIIGMPILINMVLIHLFGAAN